MFHNNFFSISFHYFEVYRVVTYFPGCEEKDGEKKTKPLKISFYFIQVEKDNCSRGPKKKLSGI